MSLPGEDSFGANGIAVPEHPTGGRGMHVSRNLAAGETAGGKVGGPRWRDGPRHWSDHQESVLPLSLSTHEQRTLLLLGLWPWPPLLCLAPVSKRPHRTSSGCRGPRRPCHWAQCVAVLGGYGPRAETMWCPRLAQARLAPILLAVPQGRGVCRVQSRIVQRRRSRLRGPPPGPETRSLTSFRQTFCSRLLLRGWRA